MEPNKYKIQKATQHEVDLSKSFSSYVIVLGQLTRHFEFMLFCDFFVLMF